MHGVNLLGIKKPQTIKVNDIKSEMLKKFYRDSKLCTIGEGTSEIQKLVISRKILSK